MLYFNLCIGQNYSKGLGWFKEKELKLYRGLIKPGLDFLRFILAKLGSPLWFNFLGT